jgi:hypothetical protein
MHHTYPFSSFILLSCLFWIIFKNMGAPTWELYNHFLNLRSNRAMPKDLDLQAFTMPYQTLIMSNWTWIPNLIFSSFFCDLHGNEYLVKCDERNKEYCQNDHGTKSIGFPSKTTMYMYMAFLLGVPFSKLLEHHLAHTLLYTYRSSCNVQGGGWVIPCTHYKWERDLMPTYCGIRSLPLFEK